MKAHILLTFFLFGTSLLYGQDFGFGKISMDELKMVKYEGDSSANAVVLKEYGMAYISDYAFNLVYSYHVRIKILSTKGFENGNVEILLQKSDAERFEKVYDIEGMTVSLNNNGNIIKRNLDGVKVLKENVNKNYDVVKFALPNLQIGSIIEYSYKIESPYIFNFRSWEFQSEIPKISSLFVAKIPAIFDYNIALIGFQKLTKQESEIFKECIKFGLSNYADCSNLTFIMEDIPAFIAEDHMTSPSNFMSAINFELKEYTNAYGKKIRLTQEWKHIDQELNTHDSFGKQLAKKNLLKDEISNVIKDKSSELEKAKSIYKHIQSNFRWNGYYGKYTDEGVKKALSKNTGNVGDINISLIAALNAADIKAEPVILSTRENGIVNKLFPVISQFNYVVCKVDIGDKYYLLDATDQLLPFGLLPLRCINDQGRVISKTQPSYWIDLKASQKEIKYYRFNLSLDEDGKLRGTMELNSSGYEGVRKRKRIKSFGSIEEYVENFDDEMPGLKILKAEINNLDDLDLVVKENFEVEIDGFQNMNAERIFFNPFLMNKVSSNPFKLNERNYPVDWGAPSEAITYVQIKFPENFILQSKPEKVGIALPGNGGKFLSDVNVDNSILTLQQFLVFNKSIYNSDEYLYLKELYNKIIETHKFDVVFKKEL